MKQGASLARAPYSRHLSEYGFCAVHMPYLNHLGKSFTIIPFITPSLAAIVVYAGVFSEEQKMES